MAGMIYSNRFYTNQYHIALAMTTNSTSDINHNVCLGRIDHVLHDVFQNSVFLDSSQTEYITNLANCKISTCALPAEPFDQIIGMMLYCKLTAVLENRMIINDLDLCSLRGDEVWFKHNQHENIGVLAQDGWWHDAAPAGQIERRRDRVVSLQATVSWRDLDLSWEEDCDEHGDEGVILTFRKDEN